MNANSTVNGNVKGWFIKNKVKSTAIGVSIVILVTFSWNVVLPSVFNQAVEKVVSKQQAELRKEIDKDLGLLRKKVDSDREKVDRHATELAKLSEEIAKLRSEIEALKESNNRIVIEVSNLSKQTHELLITLLENKEN